MLKFFKAPLMWATLILAFSSIPSSELPEFSLWRIFSGDKLIHVFLYGTLSFLLMGSSVKQYLYRRIRYNAMSFSFATAFCFGALIEIYQEFILTDRFGDWADALANGVGALMGLLMFRLLFKDYIR